MMFWVCANEVVGGGLALWLFDEAGNRQERIKGNGATKALSPRELQ